MKVLFIGGTGNISASCVRLAISRGMEVTILNRGHRDLEIPGAKSLVADIHDVKQVQAALGDLRFDAVANFIAFKPADIERDFQVFHKRTQQYLFISSASVYQKPPVYPKINESCPLANPYWEYSRDKIACEEKCLQLYREHGFPITIVRPAHTYATVIPVAIGGWDDFTIIDRMRRGKAVIIHGDGTSLWTLTHSSDFALGFVGLLGNCQSLGHAFHITSDEVLTWNQIYEAVALAAGVELNATHIASDFICKFDAAQVGNLLGDKAHSKLFDNSKIKAFVPGFNAATRFKDGIQSTVEWFEEKPERQKIVEAKNLFMDRVLSAYSKVEEVV